MKRHQQFVIPIAGAMAVLFAIATARAQDIEGKMSNALKRVFGAAATVETRTITLTPLEIAQARSLSGASVLSRVRVFFVSTGGRRVGYGVIDNVKGKTQQITYALLVGSDISVRDLEVLVYREPYGGEIAYDSFRRQFRGKTARDNVSIGRGIRNISGATISSNAVANGTRRILATLQVLHNGGRLR